MDIRNEKVLAIGIEEAARRVGVGRSFLWSVVRRGELKSYRLGRRRLVRLVDLDRWIRRHEARAQKCVPSEEKSGIDEEKKQSLPVEVERIARGSG